MGEQPTSSGGYTGVSAELDDMRTQADLLDMSGDGVRNMVGPAAGLADPSLLLRTAAFGPMTAARAQVAMTDATVRLTFLAGRTEVEAEVLRLVAGATEAADTFTTGVSEWWEEETSGFRVAWGVMGVLSDGYDGFSEELTQLFYEDPETVDALVDYLSEEIHEVDAGIPLLDGVGPSREQTIGFILGLAGLGGHFDDRPIAVGDPVSWPPDPLPTEDVDGWEWRDEAVRVPGGVRDLAWQLQQLQQAAVPDQDGSVIGIVEVPQPDGTSAWIVQIPGTQEWDPRAGATDDPNDLTSNTFLTAQLDSELLHAVDQAMRDAGVDPDAPVLVAGHSQGGIAAARFAQDNTEWNVTHVLTAGSPIANVTIPDDVEALSVEHHEDPVPRLDDGPNPDRPNHITFTAPTGVPNTGNPWGPHALTDYADTLGQIDAADDPGFEHWNEGAQTFFSGDNEFEEVEWTVRPTTREP